MNKQELENQKKFVETFIELQQEIEERKKKIYEYGYKQRNALIKHVYSGYKLHDELNLKREIANENSLKLNIIRWIYDLFVNERDLYGYFGNLDKIRNEISDLMQLAVKKEMYEKADELKKWLKKIE